jgi:hypothetical protein
MNDAEILKDIPLIHEKITRCERSVLDFERNIMHEQSSIADLKVYMGMDKDRVKEGLRPRYDPVSMQENITRHENNIQLFKEKIDGEYSTIKKFKDILAVLHNDLGKNPEQVFMYPRGM